MAEASLPDILALMDETVRLLRDGASSSVDMRQRLAAVHGVDPRGRDWPRFVNRHAWALVRLQAAGRIVKVGPGIYEEASAKPPDGVPPILAGEPLPLWARQMTPRAAWRNLKRWQGEAFGEDDIRALWDACGGRCMLSGIEFRTTQVGSGAARRPYAPSLDRIDATLPYSRANCRIVLQAVNFALNSFGDDVFLEVARATTEHMNEEGQR